MIFSESSSEMEVAATEDRESVSELLDFVLLPQAVSISAASAGRMNFFIIVVNVKAMLYVLADDFVNPWTEISLILV